MTETLNTCTPRLLPALLSSATPRERKRIIYACLTKARFPTLERASDALNKSNHLAPVGDKPLAPGLHFNAYLCPHCTGYHVGRRPKPTKNTTHAP